MLRQNSRGRFVCVVPIEIHRIIIVVGLELVNTLKSALTD